jgi:hypothetical protein
MASRATVQLPDVARDLLFEPILVPERPAILEQTIRDVEVKPRSPLSVVLVQPAWPRKISDCNRGARAAPYVQNAR